MARSGGGWVQFVPPQLTINNIVEVLAYAYVAWVVAGPVTDASGEGFSISFGVQIRASPSLAWLMLFLVLICLRAALSAAPARPESGGASSPPSPLGGSGPQSAPSSGPYRRRGDTASDVSVSSPPPSSTGACSLASPSSPSSAGACSSPSPSAGHGLSSSSSSGSWPSSPSDSGYLPGSSSSSSGNAKSQRQQIARTHSMWSFSDVSVSLPSPTSTAACSLASPSSPSSTRACSSPSPSAGRGLSSSMFSGSWPSLLPEFEYQAGSSCSSSGAADSQRWPSKGTRSVLSFGSSAPLPSSSSSSSRAYAKKKVEEWMEQGNLGSSASLPSSSSSSSEAYAKEKVEEWMEQGNLGSSAQLPSSSSSSSEAYAKEKVKERMEQRNLRRRRRRNLRRGS
ncbi:hypothetical protein ACP70R_001293 [Stipagrostis hirtigluma subsp. patula]